MFRKKTNLIGLDIGSHAVKMVRLGEKNGKLSLLNAGLLPVLPASSNETKTSRQDRLSKSVQSLSSHLSTKDKNLAMSISGYDVMIKKIELPAMTEEELEDRMHLELGQYIPYSIDEVEVDYQILDVVKDRPNFMEVLLVAAKKESINESVELARLAGFEPKVIDVDFFALCNAYEATYGLNGNETIALLDIGAVKGAMNVLHRGEPIFPPRDIPVGGEQINEAIRENFKMSGQEAERIKLGEPSSKVHGPALEQIVADVVRNWLNEIKRTVDFYSRNYTENKIDKLFLSGGCARISGLTRVLQENMDIPVEVFNPLLRVEYDQKVFDPAYLEYLGPQISVAFGLALRKNVEK
jgi:type IV pilus assembly protein PilM